MPELPEIASRAREMDRELPGKIIKKIEVLQPKCLNVPVKKFVGALTGARLKGTTYHGKWLFTETTHHACVFLKVAPGMVVPCLVQDFYSKWWLPASQGCAGFAVLHLFAQTHTHTQ